MKIESHQILFYSGLAIGFIGLASWIYLDLKSILSHIDPISVSVTLMIAGMFIAAMGIEEKYRGSNL